MFLAVPMLLTFVLGFFRVDGFGQYDFIGLANSRRMSADPQFLGSIGRTAVYIGVLVPLLSVVSLALALLVKQKFPLVGVFRSAFFVPYVVSLVVVGLVWQFMLTDRVGIVSRVLAPLGITPSWLGDPRFALASVILVTAWYQIGYYMTIFLTGLQDIPREYYEAARIDGAGAVAFLPHRHLAAAEAHQLLRTADVGHRRDELVHGPDAAAALPRRLPAHRQREVQP